jgi:hypothetical protein
LSISPLACANLSRAVYSLGVPDHAIPLQWVPVPSLARNDAEVTLMALSQNSIAYSQPSDDPWMPAHREAAGSSPPMYQGDFDTNLLGCTDQYQICNPNKADESRCTVLSSGYHVLEDVIQRQKSIGFNRDQIETAKRFAISSSRRTMFASLQGRGETALNGTIYSLGRLPRSPS